MDTGLNSAEITPLKSDYEHLKGCQIVLFDGVCGLCDRFVQTVLDNDPAGIFYFAPLQGPLAQATLARHGLDAESLESVFLVQNYATPAETVTAKSSAALKVMAQLKGPISWLKMSLIVPRFIRDFVYNIIAQNRYQVFGKVEQCRLPDPAQRARFVDI